MWNMLKVHGVGEKILKGVKAFCTDGSACVKSDMRDVRQGFVMLLWLFNLCMARIVREMKAGLGMLEWK